MFRNLRITPHSELSKLYKKWNEETEQWELGLALSDIHKIPAITFKD